MKGKNNYQHWQNTLKTNNSLEKDAHTSFHNAISHLYVWTYMLFYYACVGETGLHSQLWLSLSCYRSPVLIQNRFDRSSISEGVNSFTYLAERTKNIHPKCFLVHLQTIIEVIKICVIAVLEARDWGRIETTPIKTTAVRVSIQVQRTSEARGALLCTSPPYHPAEYLDVSFSEVPDPPTINQEVHSGVWYC